MKRGGTLFSAATNRFVLLILFSSCLVFFGNCQSEIAFTPTDTFEIPTTNSSINFSFNGTYEQANLENNTWNFKNLRLINSQNVEKLDLKVSAQNSKLMITSCQVYDSTFAGEIARNARLRYNVTGLGKQVFDLGLDTRMGEWSVILNGEWIGKNHGWSLSSDGKLTVTEAAGNITLAYYGYPSSFRDSIDGFSQTAWMQHTVIITITIVVVVIAAIAAAIELRNKNTKELLMADTTEMTD